MCDHLCRMEYDYRGNTRSRQRQASWKDTSSEPLLSHKSSSVSPWTDSAYKYWRPKFVGAGFWFGALTKLGPTTRHDNDASVQTTMELLNQIYVYEFSLLFSDVLFLIYLVVLARFALKKKLTISLPIMAANWTVGMVLGVSVAVAFLVGPQVVFLQRIWIMVGSIVVGIALCFVAYAMALELQGHCIVSRSPLTSCSCENNDDDQPPEQEPQSDVVMNAGDSRTISLLEVHVV